MHNNSLEQIMEFNEKQNRILDAAEELFAKNGFIGTSVRDIAKLAQVNIAMISYYFGSKDKLLHGLLINRTEKSRQLLKSLKYDQHISPWEKIDAIIDFYVDAFFDNGKFHTIMLRQLSLVQDEETFRLLTKIKRTSRQLIEDILIEGQEKGVFRKVNTTLTVSTILGTISQVTMSKPFYATLYDIEPYDELQLIAKVRPELKEHLKPLIRNHLEIKK